MRSSQIILFTMIVAFLGGCTRAAPPQAATTEPVSTSTVAPTNVPVATVETDQQAIQHTVDTIRRAYQKGDRDLLNSVLDQRNRSFVRLVNDRFERDSPYYRDVNDRDFQIESLQKRELGFMQAHLRLRSDIVADWLFRQRDGAWVLAEPTTAELGKPTNIESEHFTFKAYAWADDVNKTVINLLEQAVDEVHAKLPFEDDQKARVTLRPVFDVEGLNSPVWSIGQYQAMPHNTPPRIMVVLPGSFTFGAYRESEGWQHYLEQTLAHEYTHLVNDRGYTPIIRITPWMSEGLAEYVSSGNSIASVRYALDKGTLIPLEDRSPDRPIAPHDMQHMGNYESNLDINLAYGEAQSLVTFIIETYGGMDAFWRFANAYDQTQSLDKALAQGLNTDYDTFDKAWRTWLEENT